jgi:hypothetical protein
MVAWKADMKRRWAGFPRENLVMAGCVGLFLVGLGVQVFLLVPNPNKTVRVEAVGLTEPATDADASDEATPASSDVSADATAASDAADAFVPVVSSDGTLTPDLDAPLLVSLSGDPDSAYYLPDGSTISTLTTDAVTVANAAQYLNGVEDPWVSTGLFTTGDADLDQIVKDYCDAATTADYDASDNAYNTYLRVSWMDYFSSDSDREPWTYGSTWPMVYAKQLYYNNGGNFYEFAAFAAYCLRYYGYSDATAQACSVEQADGDSENLGLVFVTNWTGSSAVVDPSLCANGWMLSPSSYTYQVKTGDDEAAAEE